ncbi:inorganic phosphate transporter [Candidatus Micrarchaeota archaeon]|nr:inorganic phosphate transporter [Candidatus Micrarchaeota archaeon]
MIDIGILVIIGILLALAFDFGNGRNDAANAVSTVVATRVLSLPAAVLLSAFFNFVAAFVFSTEVAHMIGTGVVDTSVISIYVVLSCLISAIIWVYGLCWLGIPISSSHSLIGGLVGATIVSSGFDAVKSAGLIKIVSFIFFAPLLGMVFAYLFSLLLFFIIRKMPPAKVKSNFKLIQLISVSFYSLGHGTNDAQKTMGIISLLLFIGGYLGGAFTIPFWVVIISHLTIALGTLAGGRRIVKTMATKITKLRPVDGFCAETAGAGVIWLCSAFGIPVSTTHVIAGSITGVGVMNRTSAVNWNIAKKIVAAWFLTIPLTALLAASVYIIMAFALGL